MGVALLRAESAGAGSGDAGSASRLARVRARRHGKIDEFGDRLVFAGGLQINDPFHTHGIGESNPFSLRRSVR